MSPKEEKMLVIGLTFAATVATVGQFLIQYFDKNLNVSQKIIALTFAALLAAIFVGLNFVIWKKEK